MRHQLKLISVCLLLFTCLLIHTAAKPDVTYLSLKHPLSYSPDGQTAVMITEDKYVNGSLFGLTLLVVDPRNGTQSFGMHALTLDYKEFVAIPGSTHFAYLQYDPVYALSIGLFMPEAKEINTVIYYNSYGQTIAQLQTSKDRKHLCIFHDSTPHPFTSESKKMQHKIRKRLQILDGWTIMEMGGRRIRPDPKGEIQRLLTKAEKEAFTEWAPIEKPKVIPQIFTQPMPTITQDTKVQWSPDPNSSPTYIYVLDDTGIWCVSLSKPLPESVPMWTKLVNAERIHRFEISPTGTQLVYEVKQDLAKRTDQEQKADPLGLENDIWLVDITPFFVKKPKQNPLEWELDVTAELSPTKIAKGWGATFNPNGKSMIYSNTQETNIMSLETKEHYWVCWTAKQ